MTSCIGLKKDSAANLDPATLGSGMLVTAQESKLDASSVTPSYVVGENAVKHEIVSGDSLSTIAEKYGARMSEIKLANKLTSNKIIAGETLIIPVDPTAKPATIESKPIVAVTEEPAPVKVEAPAPPEVSASIPEVEEKPAPKLPASIFDAEDRITAIRSTPAPDAEPAAEDDASLSPRQGGGSGFNPSTVPPAPGAEEDDFTPITPITP